MTGRQRYITRQVNGGKREAEREEARLRAEVAAGKHRGTAARTMGRAARRVVRLADHQRQALAG